jgi:hypothetical protein
VRLEMIIFLRILFICIKCDVQRELSGEVDQSMEKLSGRGYA